MLKIHLAQINFNPAYYDPPVDFLEEPSFLNETDTPLGRLRSFDSVQSFLLHNKDLYIQHLQAKLLDILNWSGCRGAAIIAFPEYSIPVQLLPAFPSFAKKYSMLIIAGSHRITSDENAKTIYKGLGILPHSVPTGAACVPVFFPNGSVDVALKLTRSKWEANLNTPDKEPGIFTYNTNGTDIRLAVVPCVDSLHTEVLGKLWGKNKTAPDIVICPSLSPSVDLFHSTGSLTVSRDALFAYVNATPFGETFFQLPSTWTPYLKGLAGNTDTLPRYTEAILEIEVDPQKFFAKRGSIQNAPVCSHPINFPIVYTKGATWLTAFDSFKSDLIEWLSSSELKYAIDWIDSFLAEEAVSLPDLVVQNLKYLRHSVIPLYDGNIDSIKNAIELVRVSPSVDDTRVIWSQNVSKAIQILGEILVHANNNAVNTLLECLRSLKNNQQKLPPVAPIADEKPDLTKPEVSAFVGEDNLVEAFQNRGNDLDQIRTFFANTENKVIVITGSMGVGKTDFVNLIFRKSFIDWQLLRINIPKGTSTARIIADIGYSLGQSLDVDSLASASHHIFRQKVRKLLAEFYSTPKRALVLDDIQQILAYGSARDHRHLDTFFDEASKVERVAGGRIFIISSAWLPNKWLFAKGVSHLHLRGLLDVYIRRVIEYHMRRVDNVRDEAIPEPPQSLLDLVNGHPLSARLVVDAVRGKNLRELSDDLLVSRVTEHVARELLNRVELTPTQTVLMQKLSVFRLPIRKTILVASSDTVIDGVQLDSLITRCLISFDGRSLEMHEAVRRFYESQIGDREFRKRSHQLAAAYYQRIYDDLPLSGKKDPSIIAELVHHLSLSGDIHKVKNLRLLVVAEMKPTARQLYREYHDYNRALSLYRLLADITPDDPEVLAYIGRCYARLGQWADSDMAFGKAIETALKIGRPSWWLYRDWGHIKARFQYYAEAKELLLQAESMNENDASIKASLAYMHWHQGDRTEAHRLFEEAYNSNPNNLYTLTFYPKLLDEIGEYDYARSLRKRMDALEEVREYREPHEHDLEDYDE